MYNIINIEIMNYKKFMIYRLAIVAFIAIVVSIAVSSNNFYLAISAVLVGIMLMFLVKKKFTKITVDERVISISGLASRATYMIITLFLAISGLFLILSSRSHGDFYGESIGTIFIYIAMFMIAIYSISYHYFNKKYGADK